ncbi:hypothetical protein GPK41_06095 [Bifidobacterium adolescentis]|nr:hypothetical protein [Bifidobacterium adolescentis]
MVDTGGHRQSPPKKDEKSTIYRKRTKGQSVLYICLFCCFLCCVYRGVTVPAKRR